MINTQKLVPTLLKVLRAAAEGNLLVVMTYVQSFLSKVFVVFNRMPGQRIPNRGALYPPLHNPGTSNWDNKATQHKPSFPGAGRDTSSHTSLTKGTCWFWHPSHGLSSHTDSARAPHLRAQEGDLRAPVPSLRAPIGLQQPLLPGTVSAFLETATILFTEKPWHLTVFSQSSTVFK